MGSGDVYEYHPEVDMSGYVPLVKRFKGACRCSVCSSDPWISSCYVNDVVVKGSLVQSRLDKRVVVCAYDGVPCSQLDLVDCFLCDRFSTTKVVICPYIGLKCVDLKLDCWDCLHYPV